MIKDIHKNFKIDNLKLFKVKTDSDKEYRCSDCIDLPDVEKLFITYTMDVPDGGFLEVGKILSLDVFFQTENNAIKGISGNYQLKASIKSDDGSLHFVVYKLKLTPYKNFPLYEVAGTGEYTKHVFSESTKLIDIDFFHNTDIEIKATNHRRTNDN